MTGERRHGSPGVSPLLGGSFRRALRAEALRRDELPRTAAPAPAAAGPRHHGPRSSWRMLLESNDIAGLFIEVKCESNLKRSFRDLNSWISKVGDGNHSSGPDAVPVKDYLDVCVSWNIDYR